MDAYTEKLLAKTNKIEKQFDKEDAEKKLKKTVLSETQKQVKIDQNNEKGEESQDQINMGQM